jgi:hypothetical protein
LDRFAASFPIDECPIRQGPCRKYFRKNAE